MTTVIQSADTTTEVGPRTAVVRRRVLRQLGVSARDLTPVGRQRLGLYCDLRARLDLLDAHLSAVDLDPRAGPTPSPWASEYAQLHEATSRALSELERHLNGERGGAA